MGMVRFIAVAAMALLPLAASAQEVLLPAARAVPRGTAAKTPQALELPFFDDFSDCLGAPSACRWAAGGSEVNTGFALLPPTVGVLTLDALDADGNLYGQASAALFPADTALSLPIRLDSLCPADSVVLSFYYLPGGGSGNLWERVGDSPDDPDSLFLEFYSPADSLWHTVWCRGGTCEDSLLARTGRSWQYVAVPITDSAYFDSLFCFRFRNYCSIDDNGKPGMAGAGDQWNIDYVLLDRGRSAVLNPVFRDVAFVKPAPSMLRHYQAMPARQFRPSEMADNLSVTITNLYSSALASQYAYAVVADGDTLYRYDGGYENAPAFLPDGAYQTAPAHATPAVGYTFEQGSAQREYTVVHTVREGVGGDGYRQNDTVRFTQRFANYYAYDDGTPENGYGLTSTASRMYLACRFDLNEQDTLTALDMMFNNTLADANANVQFYITVWRSEDGKPGTVLYRDDTRRRPLTGVFSRYVLERALVVDGSIFVGLEQVGNDYINLGFDRNNNSSDRIYYLTSTEWQQSILSGSLLLRPCFGAAATEGIGQASADGVALFPNPASGWVTVSGLPQGSRLTLFDAKGLPLLQTATSRFDVGRLPQGLYFLKTVSPEGATHTFKLIVHHQ